MVLLAKSMPDPSLVKSWLITSAPAVSVFSAWLWRILTKLYATTRQYVKEKAAEWSFRSQVNAALNDPDIPDSEKERLKRERSQLKLERVASLTRKLRTVRKEGE